MKKYLSHIVIFCLISLCSAIAYTKVVNADNAPIEIGAIYNLTGEQSALDIPSLEGAKLAVTEINAAGGVLGRPLKLVAIDGKTQPAVITAEVKELTADKNIVAFMGLSDTDMAMAAIPAIAAVKKIFITSGATSPKLPAAAPGYVFLACFSDDQQATAAAEFAYEKLKVKTAYVLTEKDMEYAQLLARYFQQTFTKMGGKIIASDTFTHHAPDIKEQLNKIKSLAIKPDIIYLAAGPNAPLIIKQIRAAGFTQPILGGDGFDSDEMLNLPANVSNGVYYTTHTLFANNKGDAQVQQFITNYQTTYHHLPENGFAGLGYDTVKLLAKAIQTANSTDTDKIRQALLQIKFFDVVTGMMSYVNNNPIPMKTVLIVQMQNGQRFPAEQFTPQMVSP